MYSHAQSLPPLSAFNPEPPHPPLRPTNQLAQRLPTGECCFILLHPSINNQRCSCQCFHHNGKPGSSCDCGHQACYHVHTQPGEDPKETPLRFFDSGPTPSIPVLVDRIRKLELDLERERQSRDEDLRQERKVRDRELRVMREALHPFYRREGDFRKKLVELEDRIEGNYDEQVRFMERVISVDDATMALQERLDDIDGLQHKRRRTSLHIQDPHNSPLMVQMPEARPQEDVQLQGNSSDSRELLARQESTPESLSAVRQSVARFDLEPEPSSAPSPLPRSSGILDTTKLPAPLPLQPQPPIGLYDRSESSSPRSSGVLYPNTTTNPTQTNINAFVNMDSSMTSQPLSNKSTPAFFSSLAPIDLVSEPEEDDNTKPMLGEKEMMEDDHAERLDRNSVKDPVDHSLTKAAPVLETSLSPRPQPWLLRSEYYKFWPDEKTRDTFSG